MRKAGAPSVLSWPPFHSYHVACQSFLHSFSVIYKYLYIFTMRGWIDLKRYGKKNDFLFLVDVNGKQLCWCLKGVLHFCKVENQSGCPPVPSDQVSSSELLPVNNKHCQPPRKQVPIREMVVLSEYWAPSLKVQCFAKAGTWHHTEKYWSPEINLCPII